jgi:hypothetical protein
MDGNVVSTTGKSLRRMRAMVFTVGGVSGSPFHKSRGYSRNGDSSRNLHGKTLVIQRSMTPRFDNHET